MTGVADTVQLNITLDAPPIESAALGRILLAGSNVKFAERARAYASAAELLADAEAQVTTAHWEYKALQAIYSQPRVPADVLVGRVNTSAFAAQVATVTVPATPPDGVYTVRINGLVAGTFTASSSTNAAVTADLVSDINASAVAAEVTAADLTGSFTVTSDTAGDGFVITVSSPNDHMTVAITTPNAGWAEQVAAIFAEESDWHFLCIEPRTNAAIEDVAAWVEANNRLFVPQSDESGILVAATTTDLGSRLKALSYDRTGVMYFSSDAAMAAESWTGRKASVSPDIKATTWAHAQLVGITPDTLTTAQQGGAEGKNVNVYHTYAGTGATWEGKVASGRYLDVMVAADWLEARMTEDLQTFFLNVSARDEKVPYTDEGIRRIAGVIRNRLNIGQDIGHLDPEVKPRVQPPTRASVPAAEVTARRVTIPFQAQLAGGIHKVIVEGVVAVTLPT